MPDPQSLAKGLMADGPVMRAYEPRTAMARALQSNIAPYGVIFIGNDRAIVGSPHGSDIGLSRDLRQKLAQISQRHGAYYEGDGGDAKKYADIVGGHKQYRGSWDDLVAKNVKGYPPEYLSGMFSNVAVNKPEQHFSDPNNTIFNTILKNQNKMRYFKDRDFDQNTLKSFLSGGSNKDADFIALSNMPATPENVRRFFTTGEKQMWPSNWKEYPNPMGKFAQKFEQSRNNALLNAGPGVYFAGAGHLPELVNINKSLKMIGGHKAAE